MTSGSTSESITVSWSATSMNSVIVPFDNSPPSPEFSTEAVQEDVVEHRDPAGSVGGIAG